jgi:DNA-binding NtrC family response regulator
VIVMSAHATSEMAREAQQCGAIQVLRKPFDLATMLDLVDAPQASA